MVSLLVGQDSSCLHRSAFLELQFTILLFIVLMAGKKPHRTNGRGKIVNCFTLQKKSRCRQDLSWLVGVGRRGVLSCVVGFPGKSKSSFVGDTQPAATMKPAVLAANHADEMGASYDDAPTDADRTDGNLIERIWKNCRGSLQMSPPRFLSISASTKKMPGSLGIFLIQTLPKLCQVQKSD